MTELERWPLLRMFDTGDHGRIGFAVAISIELANGPGWRQIDRSYVVRWCRQSLKLFHGRAR